MIANASVRRHAANLRMAVSMVGLMALSGCVIDSAKTPVAVLQASASKTTPEPADLGPVQSLALVGDVHEPMASHATQVSLLQISATESRQDAFLEVFERGDELFDTDFNSLDGGGANVGNGMLFSRVPRADLKGKTEWASHVPFRHTGPNAQSCTACHNQPFEDGAGSAAMNVVRDPTSSGELDKFILRNTPHLFGIGGLQRLAEEMTEALHRIRLEASFEAKEKGEEVTKTLTAKGVDFGKITARADGALDLAGVRGIDEDLVVKPLQWKGTDVSIRKFTRDAAHRELGVQPIELVGEGVDGDFDGVVDEMTIGDVTAMALYMAGQPRPTTKLELADLGMIDPLEPDETLSIGRGSKAFEEIGCASCHMPSLTLNDPMFSEPSQNAHFRDDMFPSGQNPRDAGVDPAYPIRFDLTRDLPDNHLEHADGSITAFGNFETDDKGAAVVRLFGDLKRHDLGSGLAESVDEEGTGASVFMTAELWGVGDTAPYLHDGRALTLTDAILAHGGDAAGSRDAFEELSAEVRRDLIAFLNNLVLFKMEEAEEESDADVATLIQ